jgi:signal transduction histidine kinase
MARRTLFVPILSVLCWTVLLGVLFVVQNQNLRKHNRVMMLEAARASFDLIVVTREWNARHGGVYVFVSDSAQPNPYLPEENRTLIAVTGQTLARVNPAYMTRQISEISTGEGLPRLHITSLNPLRPANGPTAWEQTALERFSQGEAETAALDVRDGKPVFRYMAPLHVTEACMPCHAKQGYKIGDVRGGISVAMPASRYVAAQAAELRESGFLYCLIWAAGALGIGYGSAAILRGKQRAEAASQAKSTFLSILSHELRTPLNGVLGMVDLALTTDLTEEQRAYLEDAQTAGRIMNTQVSELLELSGLENGCGDLEITLFAPATLLDGVLDAATKAATHKHLTISSRIDPQLPKILLGDGTRFARIVEIVLQNAVKFSAAGQIEVTLSAALPVRERTQLTAVITDAGPGIDPERLKGIFEPFSQGESLLTRSKAGLGIGLAIARRHARAMHGSLQVGSAPGRGTRFRLCAPFDLPPASCRLP